MNPATTSPLGIDFTKQMVQGLLDAVDTGTKTAYHWIWAAIKQLLIEHWIAVTVILVLLLVTAIGRYLITGRWAMLGSLIYNYLYFGALLIIALIFGSDVFASDYFKIVLVVLYIACFTLVGIFLRKTGIRQPR